MGVGRITGPLSITCRVLRRFQHLPVAPNSGNRFSSTGIALLFSRRIHRLGIPAPTGRGNIRAVLPGLAFFRRRMGNALESISAASGILRFQSMGRFSVEHCVAIGSAFVSRVPLYFGMGNITMERTTDSATTACSLLPVLGTFFHRRVEEPAFDSAASDIPLSES